MEHAWHLEALIGDPPPLRTIVRCRRAPLRRALPLSRARENWTRWARSTLNGRAREPMSFWDAEWRDRSDEDPR